MSLDNKHNKTTEEQPTSDKAEAVDDNDNLDDDEDEDDKEDEMEVDEERSRRLAEQMSRSTDEERKEKILKFSLQTSSSSGNNDSNNGTKKKNRGKKNKNGDNTAPIDVDKLQVIQAAAEKLQQEIEGLNKSVSSPFLVWFSFFLSLVASFFVG
jgi:hypothetical protein